MVVSVRKTSISPTVSSAISAVVIAAPLTLIGIMAVAAPSKESAKSPSRAAISPAVPEMASDCSGKANSPGGVPLERAVTSACLTMCASLTSMASSGSSPMLSGVVTRAP